MTTNTTKKAAGAPITNGLHTDTNGANFRTVGAINQAQNSKAIVALAQDSGDHDKRLATQIARATLAGVVLIPTTDDFDRQVFIVSRWALTTQLDSLDAVTLWLDRVTGKKTEVAHAV